MKIEGYQSIQQTYGNYAHQKSSDTQSSSVSKTNDKLEISAQARQMQRTQPPDEQRDQKVDRLKAQVQTGTYHVDAEAIANKMYAYWNQK